MRQIVVPKWDGPDGFQHYKNREPIWIKTYTRLHSDDKYLSLTGHRRAVLHGIWIEYARSGRQLTDDTRTLTYRLHLKVTKADLQALETLGFIEMPLADRKHNASPDQKRPDKRQQDQPLRTTDPVDVGDLVGDGKPASSGLGASGVLTRPGSVLEQVEARAAAELGGAQVIEFGRRPDPAVARALADEFMDSLPREA